MNKNKVRQYLTVLITLVTIIINGLANTLPLNGLETGEISDRFNILFVPAGYVFAIWGLIYAGLIAFAVFQALPKQRDNALIKKITPAYWLASVANVVWLFLWHYEIFSLTLLAMLGILASLVVIYIQIRKSNQNLDNKSKWFVRLPFSIYFGWISVATIANVSQVLYFFGWSGFGLAPLIWAVIMLLVAAIIGLYMLLREKDFGYAAVLVWAFIGIAQKQADVSTVVSTAWLASGLLLMGGAISLVGKGLRRKDS